MLVASVVGVVEALLEVETAFEEDATEEEAGALSAPQTRGVGPGIW